ncbi:hypothetical protein ESCO_003161 [Escovopsis weberi]|uniref:Uncharacterized protein n=1 Tax=Escovopsis weberi TaxID=150374 RepID=A0A0N0RT31_ESCWE|nr:hypothetical protein ESCO_003161 [Escovopsis weberi]
MIRPRWARHANGPLARLRAAQAPSPDGRAAAAGSSSTPVWPLLKRKEGAHVGRYRFSARPVAPRHQHARQHQHQHQHALAPAHPPNAQGSLQHSSNANRLMLIIGGLSPALRASDFYRLGPSALSAWGAAIKKVQQRRDPATLEPSGQYWVTFDSAAAAVAFRAKLVRLHALAGVKLRSATGLWESRVPAELHAGLASDYALPAPAASFTVTKPEQIHQDQNQEQQQQQQKQHEDGAGAGALRRLVDSFTLAPASLSPIHLKRRRVAISHPWARRLAEVVAPHGFGDRPSVILVDIYPPTMVPWELHEFIRADGDARGLRWQVSKPRLLGERLGEPDPGQDQDQEPEPEPEQDQDFDDDDDAENRRAASQLRDRAAEELLKGRFYLVAPNETEAQRFHRGWNGRNLTMAHRRDGRYTARTSIVDW